MMFEQVDETSRARYGVNGVVPPNKHCYTIGMDQGLHNWLLFSGRLKRVMRVKVFSQGEGPVNALGAFYPGRTDTLQIGTEIRLLLSTN
jgi:hypothetical protein